MSSSSQYLESILRGHYWTVASAYHDVSIDERLQAHDAAHAIIETYFIEQKQVKQLSNEEKMQTPQKKGIQWMTDQYTAPPHSSVSNWSAFFNISEDSINTTKWYLLALYSFDRDCFFDSQQTDGFVSLAFQRIFTLANDIPALEDNDDFKELLESLNRMLDIFCMYDASIGRHLRQHIKTFVFNGLFPIAQRDTTDNSIPNTIKTNAMAIAEVLDSTHFDDRFRKEISLIDACKTYIFSPSVRSGFPSKLSTFDVDQLYKLLFMDAAKTIVKNPDSEEKFTVAVCPHPGCQLPESIQAHHVAFPNAMDEGVALAELSTVKLTQSIVVGIGIGCWAAMRLEGPRTVILIDPYEDVTEYIYCLTGTDPKELGEMETDAMWQTMSSTVTTHDKIQVHFSAHFGKCGRFADTLDHWMRCAEVWSDYSITWHAKSTFDVLKHVMESPAVSTSGDGTIFASKNVCDIVEACGDTDLPDFLDRKIEGDFVDLEVAVENMYNFITSLSDALCFLHDQGLSHGRISRESVKITEDIQVKLVYTPADHECKQEFDRLTDDECRKDIAAVGCMLYEILQTSGKLSVDNEYAIQRMKDVAFPLHASLLPSLFEELDNASDDKIKSMKQYIHDRL